MNRLIGAVAAAALLTAGCATAADSGRSGADGASARHSSPIYLHTAPGIGSAIEAAPAPAAVPVPRQTPAISTQRTVQGTPQAAVSPAPPAAAEQPAPASQPVNAQCPANSGSGLPCVKR